MLLFLIQVVDGVGVPVVELTGDILPGPGRYLSVNDRSFIFCLCLLMRAEVGLVMLL